MEAFLLLQRALFKNLTKGKSLIERMEDIRNESKTEQTTGNDTDSLFESSPFDSESAPLDESPSANPFDQVPDINNELMDSPQDNPFDTIPEAGTDDNLRNITPIENPIMEMEEIDIFDDGDMSVQTPPSLDSDELSVTPISPEIEPDEATTDIAEISIEEITEITEITEIEATPDIGEEDRTLSVDAESISDSIETSPVFSELSSEFETMKQNSDKRLNLLENDVIGFKDNLSGVDAQFSSLQSEVESFSDRISKMDESFSSFLKSNEEALSMNGSKFGDLKGKIVSVEGKIGDFESNLSLLQNDNNSIKADLSRIGEDVSGLVESYTALLVQLHESLQENESNFSRIDTISVKLDEIGSKIESIEKTQEGSKATSMEFSRSLSSMLDNIGKTSSDFIEFKEESEQKNADMLERIESVTEYVEKELQKVGARSYKGFGQNVHLSNIVKNSSNMKLCMEWLEFLMELVGRNNLPDILSYYEELGWITEKVRMELLHYADGIDFYMEKPDWKLTPDDHVKSIWFIESLAGLKVDKNRLSVIERDIEKVKKGSEIYGI
ncbi:MAG: FlaD/FlaE family flagellar protein [Methanolobus sp.]